jgi:hypothetical protein
VATVPDEQGDHLQARQEASGWSSGLTELIRAVGGALLAFFAVLALLILTWAKLGDLAQDARGEAFIAVVGAISTIVGGYVGLKIGASGADKAVADQHAAEQGKDDAQSDVALLMGKLDKNAAEDVKKELKTVGPLTGNGDPPAGG